MSNAQIVTHSFPNLLMKWPRKASSLAPDNGYFKEAWCFLGVTTRKHIGVPVK